MTGQTVLNYLELIDRELQLQSGEADVTRGLLALNAAQDLFESMVAAEAELLGGEVTNLVLTVNQLYSTFPAGLLRVDRLHYLDPADNDTPIWEVVNIKRTAGQVSRRGWVWGLVTNTQSGKPKAYWTAGTRLWWRPKPDAADTIRIYGFLAKADITAGSTFNYEDLVALPLATLASKLMRLGKDDPLGDISALAQSVLTPAMNQLRNFNKDGASEYVYTESHST